MQKKEKKRYKDSKANYQNMSFRDPDEFMDDDYTSQARSEKKTEEKSRNSQKAGLTLRLGRTVSIHTNYQCLVEIEEEIVACRLSGRIKQMALSTRNLLTVGDYVNVDIDSYRVEEILPRKNFLSRFAQQKELPLASNVDQVVICSSILEPMYKPGLIDRYLCAAEIYNIEPIICINKVDLVNKIAEIYNLCGIYEELGYKLLLTSVKEKKGIDELKALLQGKDTVFSGQSGTGKTSLINALMPELNLKTGEVSRFNEKGTHTTTHSSLLKWSFGGHLIDTPGIKTFGLAQVHKTLLPKIFPDFKEEAKFCRFDDCTHTHEEGCHILDLVEQGKIYEDRYQSYVRIFESL